MVPRLEILYLFKAPPHPPQFTNNLPNSPVIKNYPRWHLKRTCLMLSAYAVCYALETISPSTAKRNLSSSWEPENHFTLNVCQMSKDFAIEKRGQSENCVGHSTLIGLVPGELLATGRTFAVFVGQSTLPKDAQSIGKGPWSTPIEKTNPPSPSNHILWFESATD
jgi:hypothetical protein